MKKHLTHDSDGVSRIEFDSISELIDYASNDSNMNMPINQESMDYWHKKEGSEWVNYATRASFDKWMRDCPQYLLDTIEKLKQQVQDKIALPTKQRRKRIHRQEIGDELQAEAWIHRDPDGWDDTHKEIVTRNNIRIGVNYSTPGGMRKEALLYRGSIVAALADLLTQMGNNVEVIGFDTGVSLGSIKFFVMTTMLKPMSAPLDMASLAVACAEIGFYRVIVVPASILFADCPVSSAPCFCGPVPAQDKKNMDIMVEWTNTNEELAVKYVLDQLARFQGVAHGVV
jgi:hypothetical protein